ncbi:TonB-dependent vitamin B12 receptor BtuB [Morganella morganii subsp. morganii]|uniref:Vitamin B12 transporter BtuB n=5 Tax=Enterobacterales TaxID=91347 RepID=A0A5U8SVX4_SALET|nr:TonB-dependent vitamin B12 receptor BtuB [Morganella morganii]EBR9859123.1 TonB-dependent vitamin B12 receptor BtuB [Salmonella enterica subsp. enterica serovar Chester]EJG2203775.1 TonB-dependent vitamin B12 receptor BtuB [Morganella morganii]EKL3979735.1 TonB-dependent vitamin B12 receptor BtuB [Morganella morganii]EKV4236993.1 TonB-dependent vitamin B12 receptor BtuB [Morganella morganii]ELA8474200.1 TonB-dependent vitamin B12 receptor BtuB [Morganella morganii]
MKMTSPYALSAVGLAVFSALSFSASANTNDDQIIVSANRFQQPVSSVLAPVTVVTREEIDKWQSNSVVDILRRLPGVDVTQSGGLGQNSTVSVRGTDAKHLLVLIDGVRLNNAGISGQPDLNQFPVALVQRVEYIRGARSAVYGSDAIGGVLNIITIRDDIGSNITAGIGSHGYQNYTGTTQQQIGENTRVTAAGAYTYSKGFEIRNDYDGYYTPSGRDYGFMNKTYWLDVNHKLNEQFSVYGRAYGYDNRSKYFAMKSAEWSRPEDPANDRRELENRTYDAGVTFNQDDYSSQLLMSYSRVKDYNYDNRYGRYEKSATLDNSKQYSVQWGNNYRVGYGSINAGVDYQKQETEPGTALTAESKSVSDTGLYLTAQQQIDNFILEGAVRSDHHSQFGWHTTWQTSAGWEFIDGYRVIGSYATGFKAPTLGQLYADTVFDGGGILKGNSNLKPEESEQWELGLEGDTGPLSWKLSGYRNEIKNLIEYDIGMVSTYSNRSKAEFKGLEWVGEMDTGIFHHQLTYQYLDARNKDTNERLDRRARQQVKYQLDWVITDVDMGVTYQYISQRADKFYNDKTYKTESVSLGGTSVFDITAAYPITDHLTIRGKVANLFDKDYETAYGYRTAGREYFLTGSYNF